MVLGAQRAVGLDVDVGVGNLWRWQKPQLGKVMWGIGGAPLRPPVWQATHARGGTVRSWPGSRSISSANAAAMPRPQAARITSASNA